MKNMIMALALLSSVSAFAGTDNCKGFVGKYTCNYEGQDVGLNIVSKANGLEIKINGEGDVTKLDGVKHPAREGNTESIGNCISDKEINIKTFAPHLVGVLNETGLVAETSINLAVKGITYSVTQFSTVSGESNFKLECVRK